MLNIKKQQKFLRGTSRYLALVGRLYSGAVLSINTTARKQCGFNCKHCCNKNAPRTERKLSLIEIKSLLNSAKQDFDTRTLILPGEGDPLLDENFKNIVRHAHGLGMTTYLFNTLDRVTEELAVFCRDHDVTIMVSFTDNNEQRYDDFVRVFGAYERVMENLRMLVDVYESTIEVVGEKSIYRLAFNTDINSANFKYRHEVQGLAKKLDIMSILNYPMIEGEAVNNVRSLVREDADSTARIVFRESENGGMSFLDPSGFCGLESYGLSIGVDGRLQQCPYRVDINQGQGHVDYYRRDNGYYNLKRALDDRLLFWNNNKVPICSIRHGGDEFKSVLRAHFSQESSYD